MDFNPKYNSNEPSSNDNNAVDINDETENLLVGIINGLRWDEDIEEPTPPPHAFGSIGDGARNNSIQQMFMNPHSNPILNPIVNPISNSISHPNFNYNMNMNMNMSLNYNNLMPSGSGMQNGLPNSFGTNIPNGCMPIGSGMQNGLPNSFGSNFTNGSMPSCSGMQNGLPNSFGSNMTNGSNMSNMTNGSPISNGSIFSSNGSPILNGCLFTNGGIQRGMLNLNLNGRPDSHMMGNNSPLLCSWCNTIASMRCLDCDQFVCNRCTDQHACLLRLSNSMSASDKIKIAIESSTVGTKCIKSSIDKALSFIRLVERNHQELCDSVKKQYRNLQTTVENRERTLIETAEKIRLKKLNSLNDQMAGLKSALSGLADITDRLNKLSMNFHNIDESDIGIMIDGAQRQLEQFATVYKDLCPVYDPHLFIPPDFTIQSKLKTQGALLTTQENELLKANDNLVPVNVFNCPQNGPSTSSQSLQQQSLPSCSSNFKRLEWEQTMMRLTQNKMNPKATQCIPGTLYPVELKESSFVSCSFGPEGHEEGQVSRPWGIFVDKNSNVYVSDRRNNRVQVFFPNGLFKFSFGTKGSADGEFDLPAGITVDIDDRIIVVDKDNHRVQIFNALGIFLTKFGSYGKEYGQFQYPWDVAVNSRRQIIVTDSRNHRVQQFDSEGRFIRQIVFETGQNRSIASPRGICYTPHGLVIVTDFDNHCLYLIDPDKNEVLATKGHEGAGLLEFNRPSGIFCDDVGRIVIADSKNQRICIYSEQMEFLSEIDIRPSRNSIMPENLDEKDRTCDVAILPDGRLVLLIENSPDAKEITNPYKYFVHIM